MNSSSFNLSNVEDTIRALNRSKIDTHATRFKNIDEDKIQYHIDKDGYIIAHAAKNEVIYDEEVYFDYKINSNGYRGSHFKKLSLDDINILYAGCSFTYGEGLPEEFTWPYMLTEKIKNNYPDKHVKYFNLSQPGAGPHQIVRLCFEYFKEYGNPNYLFIMLPDVLRGLAWVDDKKNYETIIPDVRFIADGSFYRKYFKSLIPENYWMMSLDLMNMLEQYCDLSGITIIWDSWHDNSMWKQLNCKFERKDPPCDLVKPKSFALNQDFKMPENINNLPYWECARDGSHPGTAWSLYQAESYYNNIKFNKGELNEKN
jgi:hypothetical protein